MPLMPTALIGMLRASGWDWMSGREMRSGAFILIFGVEGTQERFLA